MKIKHSLLLLAGIIALGSPAALLAQDDDESGHYFAVSMYTWPFANLEEIFEMYEEGVGRVNENEYVLSRRVLAHAWAGDYSVMIITEYENWEAMGKAGERGTELLNKAYPKEKDRDARSKKFNELLGDNIHEDGILVEMPKLTKK